MEYIPGIALDTGTWQRRRQTQSLPLCSIRAGGEMNNKEENQSTHQSKIFPMVIVLQ